MNNGETSSVGVGEINLWDVLQSLWGGRLVIAATTAGCALLAIAYAMLATPIYRSEALVQPRQESKVGGQLSALAAQFGGLSALAGFSLSEGGDRAVAIATLKSRAVIETFIQEKNLLPILYESKWDKDEKRWKSADPHKVPTVWRAYNDFTEDVFRIAEDKKTGLVTVAVEWKDPEAAQQWVIELIARTNEYLRSKAILEGEKNLAYLEAQSQKVGQVELQRAAYGLVETELKKLMLAKGGEEFAIRTVDMAVVPMERLRPKRVVVTAVGVFFGGFLGGLIVLVRDASSRRGSVVR